MVLVYQTIATATRWCSRSLRGSSGKTRSCKSAADGLRVKMYQEKVYQRRRISRLYEESTLPGGIW